ncbi:Thioesterase superfamily protein [Thalictrum thalictroides]|uniref:Acyl-coenzyme A thioesterase 13 n=1 Tax=Thalictrum thalictroides TaxID=46969 RepID=A0A7J6V4E8_THATH|nr:Thioesterase superfamily protein [Thalictrum thalictroides]
MCFVTETGKLPKLPEEAEANLAFYFAAGRSKDFVGLYFPDEIVDHCYQIENVGESVYVEEVVVLRETREEGYGLKREEQNATLKEQMDQMKVSINLWRRPSCCTSMRKDEEGILRLGAEVLSYEREKRKTRTGAERKEGEVEFICNHVFGIVQRHSSRSGGLSKERRPNSTYTMEPKSFSFKNWLEDLSHGRVGHEIESLTYQGLKVISANNGLVQCTFFVPKHLSDKDGNWHMGAMATSIDGVGYIAIAHSSAGHHQASVNFDISYLSTVKIEEEVEIEAKVLSHKDKLSSVQVEIRRKGNGELVALGKQWMITSVHYKKSSKL